MKKVHNPDGKLVVLDMTYEATDEVVQSISKIVRISGSSITKHNECYVNFIGTGSSTSERVQETNVDFSNDEVYIWRVVGYA